MWGGGRRWSVEDEVRVELLSCDSDVGDKLRVLINNIAAEGRDGRVWVPGVQEEKFESSKVADGGGEELTNVCERGVHFQSVDLGDLFLECLLGEEEDRLGFLLCCLECVGLLDSDSASKFEGKAKGFGNEGLGCDFLHDVG